MTVYDVCYRSRGSDTHLPHREQIECDSVEVAESAIVFRASNPTDGVTSAWYSVLLVLPLDMVVFVKRHDVESLLDADPH